MATVEENVYLVFKNARKKQQFLETYKSQSTTIPGTDIVIELTAEELQLLKDKTIELCDESITALNEIKTAASGGA